MAALCVCTILGEDWRDAMEKVGERPLLFLAASLGGVVVNLATNMMVAATSALTLRVTSLLRNIGIVFVSTAVLRDSTLTLLEGIGFCTCPVSWGSLSNAKGSAFLGLLLSMR